jgi:hypothetical protein
MLTLLLYGDDIVYPLWILKHPLKATQKNACFSRQAAAQHFLDFQDAFNLGNETHN